MQLRELDRRETTLPEDTSEKPQRRSTTAVDPVASQYAVDEINAYIAIRDNLLAEAEATAARPNLRRLSLANDFVQSCLKPAWSPYEAQYLPERDADRERKRCAAVKIRIADLAHDLVARKIDNHDLRRVRDVKFSRLCIDRQIIPTAFASDRNAL